MTTTVAVDTLSIRRILPAPPERVFRFWTDPARLTRWFGPPGTRVAACTLDPRETGAWRVEMLVGDGAVMTVSGVYRIVDPPHRIAFTWAWDRPDGGGRGPETRVEVHLAAHRDGTELVLVHAGFADAEQVARHRHGWDGSLDRLDKLLAPGSDAEAAA